MKKLLALLLVCTFIFGSAFSVAAEKQDAELNMQEGNVTGGDIDINAGDLETDPEAPEVKGTAVLEAGRDDGYLTVSGDTYTAVPYAGNEFLGWYKDGELVSSEATVTPYSGEHVAKFKNNNILINADGYELADDNTELIGDAWKIVKDKSWRSIKPTTSQAKTGKKSLRFYTRKQRDIYTELSNLEKDTYYTVSYYWMLPATAATDSETAADGYYGSAIATEDTNDIFAAYALRLGGDYTGTKNSSFVGGVWNKVEYTFYSGDYEKLRLFISYDSEPTANQYFYLDEFTVFKAPDQQAVATYKPEVTAENGYAYVVDPKPVKYDTEVTVVAAPFGGYEFDGWYENGVKVSSDKIYTFKIQSNRELVAKCIPIVGGSEYTPDMDANGSIDLQDVVLLAQFVAGWEVDLSEIQADVDGNGSANLQDVVLLAQFVAGWEVENEMAGTTVAPGALPEEDLNDEGLKALLLAGQSEYYNTRTVINKGNQVRIANVFRKAQRGEDITIVGFGGSITQGAAASSVDNRYGERVAAWFREQFPNIKVTYFNAGIGSTPSLVGIHRIKEHVLDHNPDFVLVDFTTNDGANDFYQDSYEAVIRTLVQNDIAVLSVLYGSVGNYSATNGAGTNTKNANGLNKHLPSLLHYDIPTIDYFGSLWRYIEAGVISWTDVAGDYIHPSNNGHLMSASAICKYLHGILHNLDNIGSTAPAVPTDFIVGGEDYMGAQFIGGEDIEPTANDGFEVSKVHGNLLKKGWVCADEEGGSVTLEVKNVKNLTLFIQLKEGNGKGSIIINGKTVVANTNGNNSSTGGFIWYSYRNIYDEPTDLTITVECEGKFGLGPIGVVLGE